MKKWFHQFIEKEELTSFLNRHQLKGDEFKIITTSSLYSERYYILYLSETKLN